MSKVKRENHLSPFEIAEAAWLGDLALAMIMIGWFVSPLAAVQWLSVVPFAMLAHRIKLRGLIYSTLAIGSLGFLIGGANLVIQIYLASVIGYSLFKSVNKKGAIAFVLGNVIVVGIIPAMIVSDALLFIFVKARNIILNQIVAAWKGFGNFLLAIGNALNRLGTSPLKKSQAPNQGVHTPHSNGPGLFFDRLGSFVNGHLGAFIHFWYLSFPISATIGLSILSLILFGATRKLLKGLVLSINTSEADNAWKLELMESFKREGSNFTLKPVPVYLENVSFSYPSQNFEALKGINLCIEDGSFKVLAGPNGSGKTTLGWILAGLNPSSGEVKRDGLAGLGLPGGTAMIFQNPETQVLGARVIDDVLWGADKDVDADTALKSLGLFEIKNQETHTLSGGQLQRLALASAFCKSPKLLISDESTAMIDLEGRQSVFSALEDISKTGVSVVHSSHIKSELMAKKSEVIYFKGGEIVDVPSEIFELKEVTFKKALVPLENRKALLSLEDVSYVYSKNTPWEKQALFNVNLTIHEFDTIAVVGENGSGKSTLAWILAGLAIPTSGRCRWLGERDESSQGEDMALNIGKVSLVFQNPRLSLLRERVRDNLIYRRLQTTTEEIYSALKCVNLGPEIFMDKKVSELSGGQLRRVALAQAFTQRASVVVLDEPLAGLDEESAISLLSALSALRLTGKAIVFITHDPEYLEQFSDYEITMVQGRMEKVEKLLSATRVFL